MPFSCSWWFFARCRLIQECWDPMPSVRPTFAEIIVRLNKIHANCAKQGSWRDTFKLPWYISYHLSIISCQSPVQLLFNVLPVWPFPTIASPFWCTFQKHGRNSLSWHKNLSRGGLLVSITLLVLPDAGNKLERDNCKAPRGCRVKISPLPFSKCE